MRRASRRIPTRPVRVPRVRDMGGARRVPWRDWAEWDLVRSGLCGDDPQARDASIARVADWRRRGRVPHAVDCTASLLETRALDAGVPGNVASGSGAPLSENMLRLAYAAALVRMVNGAVDPSQKGKYAAPVMTLAKRMGIPAVLVDVRMAASHQEMPALALLRHASERALQWLFERYWHAQANQLRELRRGAERAAEDLVRAEAARRVKAERANAFRKAERGKGKAKTRARNGGVHVEDEDSDDDDDDDDDSSGGDDDDAIREKKKNHVEGADSASRDARRTATNRLFAAASREDTETCAEALLSVAVDVSRAPDGEPPGSSPTLADWRAVASRLLKRWPTLDEAMLLKAADAALEPGSPSTSRAAATDLGDARARAATAAATLFAETSLSKTQKTQPPAKRKRAFFLARDAGEEERKLNQSDVDARREKTHWYLTRRALAFANAAVMTDARRAFVETLVRTAPGAGRSFKAAAARLLFDGEVAGSDPAEDADENVSRKKRIPASAAKAETDEDDDDAFLAAARRDAAKRRGVTRVKTLEERKEEEISGVFEKVSDWTPCAVGDLPAHVRGDVGLLSRRVDARDALRLAAERAEFLVTTRLTNETERTERTESTKADLLWARWPRFAGFGAETRSGEEKKKEKEAPRTNYAVGAPFADETRRALAGPGPESRDGSDYVPDEAVAAAGEMASGRFLCGFASGEKNAFSFRDEIDETPARVSIRAAASLVFVDPDDDSDTEPMEDADEKGTEGTEALRDGEAKETTSDAFGEDDDDVWGYDDPEEEDDETEEPNDDARRDAISSDEEKDEDENEDDDGVAVRVGGVRVKLSASDRNAVAADVECLM